MPPFKIHTARHKRLCSGSPDSPNRRPYSNGIPLETGFGWPAARWIENKGSTEFGSGSQERSLTSATASCRWTMPERSIHLETLFRSECPQIVMSQTTLFPVIEWKGKTSSLAIPLRIFCECLVGLPGSSLQGLESLKSSLKSSKSVARVYPS